MNSQMSRAAGPASLVGLTPAQELPSKVLVATTWDQEKTKSGAVLRRSSARNIQALPKMRARAAETYPLNPCRCRRRRMKQATTVKSSQAALRGMLSKVPCLHRC